MRSTADYLRDILRELNDIAEFTQGGREVFLGSRQIQKAVIKSYENVGEIVKRIPSDLRENHLEIPWTMLAGFRDFLIHSYDRVIPDNVWAAVEDLSTLKAGIETVLYNLDHSSPSSTSNDEFGK